MGEDKLVACADCGRDFHEGSLILRDYGTDAETGYRDVTMLCEECAVRGVLVLE